MCILDVIEEVAFVTSEVFATHGTGYTLVVLVASGVSICQVATAVPLVTGDTLPASRDTSQGPVRSGTRLGHQVNQTDQLNAEPTVT